MKGRVLVIAGSDSSGGAGIQADIKTITVLGGYAATAITALTAQNTLGVFDVLEVPEAFIRKQIEVVVDDIGVDAIKTGMLHHKEVISTIVSTYQGLDEECALVVDPVMISKSGTRLLAADAVSYLIEELLPMATIVTPNIPEAEAITGLKIRNEEEMVAAASKMLEMGCKAVLLKGGHLEGNDLVDVFMDRLTIETFHAKRIKTTNTHGTGCTLASAIACCLAKGKPLKESVMMGRAYVRSAIKSAPGLGKGHGPLNHRIGMA